MVNYHHWKRSKTIKVFSSRAAAEAAGLPVGALVGIEGTDELAVIGSSEPNWAPRLYASQTAANAAAAGLADGIVVKVIGANEVGVVVTGSVSWSGSSITAPSLASGVELAENDVSQALTITNNDANNPVAVELSDSLGYLVFGSPHHGSNPGDPTFAIKAGGSLDVMISRSGTVPGSGGPWSATVTATTPDGSTVTTSVSVEAPSTVDAYVKTLATNLHAWSCASETGGDLTDDAQGYTAAHGVYTGTPTLTTPHPSIDTLLGEVALNAASEYVKATLNRSEMTRFSDHSFVIVYETAGSAGSWIFVFNTSGDYPGYLGNAGVTPPTFAGPFTAVLSTAHDHTVDGAGNSQAMPHGTSGDRCAFAVIYDSVAEEYTLRWKSSAHTGSGHSFTTASVAKPGSSPSGTHDVSVMGHLSSTAKVAVHEGAWLLDDTISAAEFDVVCNLIGI